MNMNVLFPHISLLTNTRPICITTRVVVKLPSGEAAVAAQDGPCTVAAGREGFAPQHHDCLAVPAKVMKQGFQGFLRLVFKKFLSPVIMVLVSFLLCPR